MDNYRDEMTSLMNCGPQSLYTKTGCHNSCSFTTHRLTTSLVNTMEDVSIEVDGYTVRVMVWLTPIPDQVETEIVVYDFYDLIGDIGGFLGLLLGASLLSMYDEARRYFQRKYRKSKILYVQ